MNRVELDHRFDEFFAEAVREDMKNIITPSDEAVDASWNRMKSKMGLTPNIGCGGVEAYVEL